MSRIVKGLMVLFFGALCVCCFFTLLFGLWGYSGMGWWSFLPFAVLSLVLAGFLFGRMMHIWA